MKTLTLLRHAKSSWAEPGMNDFDRPLNKRGREAARLVGRELHRRKMRFDLALASPATRVRETLAHLVEGSGEELNVRFDQQVYLADPDTLLDLVRSLPDGVESVLLVGHNPGFHQLAVRLTAEDERSLRSRLVAKYPTGALAMVELPVKSWNQVSDGLGTITDLILPRDLSG